MRYAIEIADSVRRTLPKLPPDVQRRVNAALELLAENPFQNTKQLAGHPELRRYRLGNYRIIYQVFANRLHILVIRVAHRSHVYRGL